ncbi:MAG: hypothetical protein J2P45_23645 [Candidatus Dormibacteraeota bacterium]|nr:hypothetical protein [Candidatus Dormibacteraeota bacterium]
MNGHEAWLDPATIVVEQGRDAICRVGITNTGEARDQFYVEVLGTAASWLVGEPPTVSLGPGESGSVDLKFRAARNHGAAPVLFAVHVLSKSRGLATSVVQQGTLQVHDSAATIGAPDPGPSWRLAESQEVSRPSPAPSEERRPPAPGKTSRRPHNLGRKTFVATVLALVVVAGVVISNSDSLRQLPRNLLAEGERRAAAENTPGQIAVGSPVQSAVSPTPSATPTLPTQGLGVPSPAPACPAGAGGAAVPASVTDVRAGAHAGYDSLVIQFNTAVPSYQLAPTDASGGWQLQLSGLGGPGSYPHGTDIKPGLPSLKEVKVSADAAGSTTLAIVAASGRCPKVSSLGGPPRLVIDFPTQ